MVTCSFFGHETLYDWDLYPRILKAIQHMAAQDTEIEFVFDRYSPFQFLCLSAILEARQRSPDKRLKTTLLTRYDLNELWRRFPWGPLFPSCAFDKVIHLPEAPEAHRKQPWAWRREKRALLDRSGFLIGYEYPDLRDTLYDSYEYALRRSGLTVIDVTARETAQAIRDHIKTLETTKQYILHAREAGKSHRAIGAELGLTGPSVREKELQARRTLRRFAEQRFHHQRAARKGGPASCAIVLPARMDEVDELRFRQAVAFLTLQMGVTRFLVEQFNCRTPFVDCLLQMKQAKRFRVELVTHYSDSVATTWGSTTEGFVPPFDGLTNMDSPLKQQGARYFRALSALLAQSDYLICKSTIDGDPAIFRQFQKHKRLRVLNLSISQEHSRPKLID